jgi:hypothetical protein
MTRTARPVVEVACDESGFVGGSLFGGGRVFAHASLDLRYDVAAELVEELRRRLGAQPGELKASRLNRPWAEPVAAWLCAPGGPLTGHTVVHLTDTRLFGLARLAQVLRSDAAPEGWWSAREEPRSWALALQLYDVIGLLPPRLERDLLVAARDLLWIRRRRHLGATIEAWVRGVRDASAALDDAAERRFLTAWAAPDAQARAGAYVATPPVSPLSEPLLPAVRWAVQRWSAQGDVHLVHDEQSVLTPARVAAIAAELAAAYPGRRMVGFSRVDSRDDARVQVADLVAGVVRRAAEGWFSAPDPGRAIPFAHLISPDSLLLPTATQSSSRKSSSQSRIGSGTSS